MDLERSTMLYNISTYKYNKTISIYPVQKFIVLTHYEVADTSRSDRECVLLLFQNKYIFAMRSRKRASAFLGLAE